MNIKSILFPTDFSECNDAALRLASSLAAEAKATLHIVYVHDVRNLSAAMGEGAYLYASSWEDERRRVQEQLREVVPTVPGVNCVREFLTGMPVAEILQFAENNDVDMVVMASHGRTGLSRLLMGSVAEGVMRKARCPVLVVKQPVVEGRSDARCNCNRPKSEISG
jgi:nucleotide-binding universal stress UspA family protein